jgi:DNA-binding transcriptional LysR family regulator
MIQNLRQLNLNLLVVFDMLMREQQLSRAAEQLHMSQPAVSNALARLRAQLGQPLFTRTARGLVPTPQAVALHEPIRQAMHLLMLALGPQAAFEANRPHTFRLAMNDYGQGYLLPPLMAHLSAIAPGVTLSVMDLPADRLPRALATGEVDLAIDYLYFEDDDLRYEPWIEQSVSVIGRVGHPAFESGLTLARYEACRHVSVQPRAGRGSPLEILLGSARVRRQVGVWVPHYLGIPAIVAHTDLLGVVPTPLAASAAVQHGLEVAPLPVPMPGVQVSLIWHEHQHRSPALRWLRTELTSLARAMGLAQG